ncbi:Calx-beta domain-containing protein [Catellatospora sp. KI3]|uniref:Calx-beta domain-containing protein n=1 Tax=Catellatospora sp. KI3 TaxID=3041620 RepID=UPI0024822035|nr:Calx-beta domain-containing protein [Catellatospora sp. KI3]MDI1463322.1 Calx-beta domain-containing protein [Catellatospora sp. KI3]
MIRLLRLPLLTAAAAALLLAVTLLPGGPAATAPIRPVDMTLLISPSPLPSPTASGCAGCVQPLDTLCWEGPPRCMVVVLRTPPRSNTVTAHFRTVAMTARPGIDYVGVDSGTLVLQPNQSSAEIAIQLLPHPPASQDRTFGVELFAVSGAGLARPMAIVTVKPAQH